uniref:Protein disulfide isomerase like, testis expressed n=1 Tax=Chelonoidis abingdonii TaxID=106734 RepID=A0A8C0G3L8_CHEAB
MLWLSFLILPFLLSLGAEDGIGPKETKPKRARLPKIKEENNILVLKKSNFDRALKETKYLLVEFYAPWSHDCRKLLPIWDELGKKYEHHGNIVIAKIDFTANDIQLVMLDRHPFFRFFPVGSNNQVRSIPCVYVENASSGSKKFNSMILL